MNFGDLPPQAYPSGMNPLFSLHYSIYRTDGSFFLQLAGHLSFAGRRDLIYSEAQSGPSLNLKNSFGFLKIFVIRTFQNKKETCVNSNLPNIVDPATLVDSLSFSNEKYSIEGIK
ncbi:hypothetical protein BpHYR1_052290 [Brachionus plicatilis]|uniref:Uncharacterized protein n=1 Tax=Brachionus plicatilis TaxID=10195 RepID=A0A3M7RMR5_BRAPC|nr:hypothetical protein BpHYR1_052290 [Brachionus plicatilis]